MVMLSAVDDPPGPSVAAMHSPGGPSMAAALGPGGPIVGGPLVMWQSIIHRLYCIIIQLSATFWIFNKADEKALSN